MADVSLFIYSGTSVGNGVTLSNSGNYELEMVSVTETSTKSNSITTKIVTTTTTTNKFAASLTKLNYQKMMYKPCRIHAELQVTGEQTKVKTQTTTTQYDNNGTQIGDPVKGDAVEGSYSSVTLSLNDINKSFKGAKVQMKIGGNLVADNYYVFKVSSLYKKDSSNTSYFVELTIFSEDKLLTQDKFSKAYTAKKLGADIFKTELQNYNLSGTSANPNYSVNLQILSYGGSKELRQPYLVQYNESFYDFLKRTANRCGEFLYHENGKFHLGVSLNRLDKDKKDSNNTVTEKAVDYSTKVQQLYQESLYEGGALQSGKGVDDYAYNYLQNVDSESSHFAEEGIYHYNDPLGQDDYLGQIGKKLATYSSQWGLIDKNAMSAILTALSGTSLSGIISTFSANELFKLFTNAIAEKNVNDFYKTINITPWQDDKDSEEKPLAGTEDQWSTDNEMLCQFGTYDKQTSQISTNSVNLGSLFFSLIRQAEKTVGEEAVIMDFGDTYQHLSLGDVILVEVTSYLVIQVTGCYEYANSTTTAAQRVVAIPLYKVPNSDSTAEGIAIPPALPGLPVRESQPQLAFVTDYYDPKKIGRVRVRFAWQDPKGDSTPWIRVSLPFATDGGGVKFTPAINDEVLVSFEEGNVDRPYVSGYLLSERSNQSWKALPDRTITSKNGHSITFNDGVDGGSFYYNLVPAISLIRSFFPTSVWPNVLTDSEGSLALSGGTVISDRYGLYKIMCSSDSRSVQIQSAMGNVTLSAFTGITISAPNGNITIAGKNVNIAASNKVNITSGTDIMNRFIPAGNNGGIRAGRFAWDTLIGVIEGVARKVVDRLLDLTLIRSVLEIVLRPIDGTTTIKSFTFVQVEAGKGSVEFPADAKIQEDAVFTNLVEAIDKTTGAMSNRVDAVHNVFDILCRLINAWNDLSKADQWNAEEKCINFKTIFDKDWKDSPTDLADGDFKWDQANFILYTVEQLTQMKDAAIQKLQTTLQTQERPKKTDDKYKGLSRKVQTRSFKADLQRWDDGMARIEHDHQKRVNRNIEIPTIMAQIRASAQKLHGALKRLYMVTHQPFEAADITPAPYYRSYVAKALNETKLESNMKLKDIVNGGGISANLTTDVVGDWDPIKADLRRKAVYNLLSNSVFRQVLNTYADGQFTVNAPTGDPKDDLSQADAWKNSIVNCITMAIPSVPTDGTGIDYFLEKGSKTAKNWWEKGYASPWRDAVVNRHRWKTGVQGKILLSDTPGKTVSFGRTGETESSWNTIVSDKYGVQLKQKLLNL